MTSTVPRSMCMYVGTYMGACICICMCSRTKGWQTAVAISAVLAAFDAKRQSFNASPHELTARFNEMRRRHRQFREQVPFLTHELRPD